MEQYGTELKRSIVSDAETPVGRYLAFRIDQIPFDNRQQAGDLLGACLMRTQPAVIGPLL